MNLVRDDGVHVAGPWYACRDQWHREQETGPGLILMAHRPAEAPAIRSFISLAEDLLQVDRTEFYVTQRKSIMCLYPSPFWLQVPMRSSLFTIMLRAGMRYKEDFDEALYGNYYGSQTKAALERFFAGHTHYRGKKRGWVNQFRDRTPQEVHRLLA